MKPLLRSAWAGVAFIASLAQPALAQTRSAADSYSLLPYTTGGYVGLNVGATDFKSGCGVNPAFVCDDSDGSFRIYTGGMSNPYFGAELGYVHLGNAERAGGETRAQGIHLSLLGRLPVGESFGLYAKIGALYGRTRVSANPASGLVTGSDSGWGATYAIGASYEVNRNWSVLLEHERHDFHFAGVSGRQAVQAVSLGVKYKF